MEATQAPTIDPNWHADLSPKNEKNVTLDDLKFIFGQAEKRMDDGIKNFDATTTKSINFIALSAALLTAMSAYFFTNFDPQGQYSPKLLTVAVACLYTAVVLYRFVGIILPKTYQPIGTYPQFLFADDFFEDNDTWKQPGLAYSTWCIYLSELESYQRRIKQNATANEIRLGQFNQSTQLICTMPIGGLVLYLLLLSLSLLA